MKKLFMTVAAAIAAMGIVSAQDLNSVLEEYNAGAAALNDGNKELALSSFKQALADGEALGADGEEVVANCKNAIPSVILSMGKELYNNKDFSGALSKVKEAAATAKEYGVEEVTNEANELLPTISLAYGTDAMKNKDYATAVSAFQDAVDADTTNGMASLLLGQALSASGKTDEAIEAYKSAANNGKADVAGKQISIIYLKQAATSLKSKNYEKAESLAEEALKYDDNAQAYLVAGQAASALKDNKSAISNYEKYLEAAPNSKNYNAIAYTVAALYQTSGNKTKAVEYYKKVVNDAKFGATAKKMIASLSN